TKTTSECVADSLKGTVPETDVVPNIDTFVAPETDVGSDVDTSMALETNVVPSVGTSVVPEIVTSDTVHNDATEKEGTL
ncbi:hypothetical protein L195_g063663, partial [Trifolium pratense]